MGASNAGGVGRNRNSEPIFGYIACCERCDGELLQTLLLADTQLSIDACYQLTVVCPVQWCITVTVQVCLWHRKPHTSEYAEEKRTLFNLRKGKSNAIV